MSVLEWVNSGVKAISPYQGGMPIEDLARERGLEPSSIIKLASNENPLGASDQVRSFIAKEGHELSRYPDGNGFALKEALRQKLGVAHNQVVLGNGSNDVLELIAQAFLGPDRSAVFSQHAFAVYPLATLGMSATPIIVPAKKWGHDLSAMAEAIRPDTRVVFVANPNNPTGTWLTKAEVEGFLRQVPSDVVVVMDEAYCEYIDHPDYPNALDWLDEFENLIVTRTFSKIYGLASLRVGYGVMSEALSDILNRVRQPFNVNSFALRAACIALEDEQFVKNSKEQNQQGLRQLEQGFNRLGVSFIPSLGNFIAFYVGDEAKMNDRLLDNGVIVRPCFGYEMPGYLRVSVGTEMENTRFLEVLETLLGSE